MLVHADVKAKTAEETLFVFRLSDQQLANQLVRLLNAMGDVARRKTLIGVKGQVRRGSGLDTPPNGCGIAGVSSRLARGR